MDTFRTVPMKVNKYNKINVFTLLEGNYFSINLWIFDVWRHSLSGKGGAPEEVVCFIVPGSHGYSVHHFDCNNILVFKTNFDRENEKYYTAILDNYEYLILLITIFTLNIYILYLMVALLAPLFQMSSAHLGAAPCRELCCFSGLFS